MKALRWKFIIVALSIGAAACDPESNSEPIPDAEKDNYIPRVNTKYHYSVIEDGVNIGTAEKRVISSRDSSSIKLYNLRTDLQFAEGGMTLYNEIYDANARTYTQVNMPDAWYLIIEELRKNPDIIIDEARVTGFPYFMVMDNALVEGSNLTWEIPEDPGQIIKYRRKDAEHLVFQMKQTLLHQPTKAAAVESVTVPAGTFVCTKYIYEIAQDQTLSLNGEPVVTITGTETVTIWMAHGIGLVKQENTTIFNQKITRSSIILNKIAPTS